MEKVYAVFEYGSHYGGDYDDMNCDYGHLTAIYGTEDLAKAHLEKWEDNSKDELKSDLDYEYYEAEAEWHHHERDIFCVYGPETIGCRYEEVNILYEVRLE